MSALAFENAGKRFGAFDAVHDVSFEIDTGALGVIIGPSGCGKSTLLSLAAGLDTPSAGRVLVDGRPVRGITRDVAMIFQSNNLFPWASARDNVAFGMEMHGLGRKDARGRANELLAEVGLAAFAGSVPGEMSGGMRQRVALARVLALEPRLILMDEPFAALDYQTRRLMQRYLLVTARRTGATILLVTHDLSEALTLASRLILFSGSPGRVREIIDIAAPPPRDVSDAPLAAIKQRLESHLEAETAACEFTADERAKLIAS